MKIKNSKKFALLGESSKLNSCARSRSMTNILFNTNTNTITNNIDKKQSNMYGGNYEYKSNVTDDGSLDNDNIKIGK